MCLHFFLIELSKQNDFPRFLGIIFYPVPEYESGRGYGVGYQRLLFRQAPR